MSETPEPAIPPPDAEYRDPLTRQRTYALAKQLLEEAWGDAEKLRAHPLTADVAGQLYLAVGSIAVNLAEGYSRSSGRDRCRFFEYALGSARECIEWYDAARPVLDELTPANRIERLAEIRRLLLAIIPRERDRKIRPNRPAPNPPPPR